MRTENLPWDWDEKVKDFIKPGDRVVTLRPGFAVSQIPPESAQVILSRGPLWDLSEIWRALKPGGFFLTECVGGEDSRALANFLLPGSHPASTVNLENQLPRMEQAGFRVMYRNQAYPAVRFDSMEELLRFIALFPQRFPGFSKAACEEKLKELETRLDARGFLENREHRFILIGKKQG